MSFVLITGYWCGAGWRGSDSPVGRWSKPEFFETWWRNSQVGGPIHVIASESMSYPKVMPGYWTHFHANLGHAHDLDAQPGEKLCGWSAVLLTGAMIAYASQADLVFKEQDCLAFGPWLETMYDIGTDIVVGRSEDANGMMVEQSLMLFRRNALLDFIRDYVCITNPDGGPASARPETKFAFIFEKLRAYTVGRLPFGVGRGRPFPDLATCDPWYAQQLTAEELELLSQERLI